MNSKIGTLIFVESESVAKIDDLCYLPGCIDELGILKDDQDWFIVKSGRQRSYRHIKLIPVVISHKEQIIAGDSILCDDRHSIHDEPRYSFQIADRIENGWIFTKEEPGIGHNPDWTFKIIADPKKFTRENFQEIIKGKIKENGIVSIEDNKIVRATNDMIWDHIKAKLCVGDSEDDKNIDWVISMLKEEYNPPKPKKK